MIKALFALISLLCIIASLVQYEQNQELSILCAIVGIMAYFGMLALDVTEEDRFPDV